MLFFHTGCICKMPVNIKNILNKLTFQSNIKVYLECGEHKLQFSMSNIFVDEIVNEVNFRSEVPDP